MCFAAVGSLIASAASSLGIGGAAAIANPFTTGAAAGSAASFGGAGAAAGTAVAAGAGAAGYGLGVTAAGTGTQVYGTIAQGAAMRRGEKANASLQSLRAQRERTQQVRLMRIRAAEITQMGENQGTAGASSVEGATMGIIGQMNQNIAFINQQEAGGMAVSGARNDAAKAGGIAALGTGMANFGGTIFNNREEVDNIFA